DLLTEAEHDKNRIVLFGKKNWRSKSSNLFLMSAKCSAPQGSSAASKKAVCKRIAQAIVPDLYAQDASTAGDCVRGEFLLQATGGGVDDAPLMGNAPIPPEGPDMTTSERGCNLWADIVKKFPFFPHLYLQLSECPSIVPVAVVTGIGPAGHHTHFYQASQPASPPHDDFLDNIDPVLRDLDVNVRSTPPASQPQSHASPERSQENKAPLSTLKTSPRASTFELKGKERLAAAMENANIKSLPAKCTLDDRLCEMQE
ncbi:hypothetical protein B0H21DRAFT_702498, partial [Amylocystis lapponica]